MNNKTKLPEWLILWIWRSLLGEIYPNVRAIAVSFTSTRELTLRYYLDRSPTDFDFESIGSVMANILASTSSEGDIAEAKEECECSTKPLGELDVLDGLVYARREYEL